MKCVNAPERLDKVFFKREVLIETTFFAENIRFFKVFFFIYLAKRTLQTL